MSKIKDLIAEHEDLKKQVKFQNAYLKYLREWYRDHSASEFDNMEPASFDEFLNNEYLEAQSNG